MRLNCIFLDWLTDWFWLIDWFSIVLEFCDGYRRIAYSSVVHWFLLKLAVVMKYLMNNKILSASSMQKQWSLRIRTQSDRLIPSTGNEIRKTKTWAVLVTDWSHASYTEQYLIAKLPVRLHALSRGWFTNDPKPKLSHLENNWRIWIINQTYNTASLVA